MKCLVLALLLLNAWAWWRVLAPRLAKLIVALIAWRRTRKEARRLAGNYINTLKG